MWTEPTDDSSAHRQLLSGQKGRAVGIGGAGVRERRPAVRRGVAWRRAAGVGGSRGIAGQAVG